MSSFKDDTQHAVRIARAQAEMRRWTEEAKDNAKPVDWPEDFGHENGMYFCRCFYCGGRFTGYKRRVVCKVCATDDAARAERQQSRYRALFASWLQKFET